MTNQPQPLRAAFWMTGAIASFTAMAIAGRQVSHLHDSFEIMTARSLVGFGIVLIYTTACLLYTSRCV